MGIKKESNVTAPQNVDPTDESKSVAEALARKTADGKGADPVPEADFQSFATEGVEKNELLSVQDVTKEVLAGRWGVSFAVAQDKLEAAGYDTEAVWAEYQRRKAGGAPTAF